MQRVEVWNSVRSRFSPVKTDMHPNMYMYTNRSRRLSKTWLLRQARYMYMSINKKTCMQGCEDNNM